MSAATETSDVPAPRFVVTSQYNSKHESQLLMRKDDVTVNGEPMTPITVLSCAERKWRSLGGKFDRKKNTSGGYIKFVHPTYGNGEKACLCVDLTPEGAFDYFVHNRIRTLDEWTYVFSELADAFRPYDPAERGIHIAGRLGRIESKVANTPHWSESVERLLEITLEHWTGSATRN